MALGICDWGIGGLGLYRGLRSQRPNLDIVYLSDRGTEAYDLLSREALMERVDQVLHTFASMGIDRVVMASDAASTTLGDVSVPGVKATGVIDPVLRSMRNKKFKEIGVIGGRRTILSGAYGRALRKQRFMVVQRVSTDLTQAIESGQEHAPETREMVRELLEPLLKADGLLIACTHYPLIIPTIRSILPRAEIIDPTAETLRELLVEFPDCEDCVGSSTFLSTGDPTEVRERVHNTFGTKIEVREIELDRPPASVI